MTGLVAAVGHVIEGGPRREHDAPPKHRNRKIDVLEHFSLSTHTSTDLDMDGRPVTVAYSAHVSHECALLSL